jgi:hypothetical protein
VRGVGGNYSLLVAKHLGIDASSQLDGKRATHRSGSIAGSERIVGHSYKAQIDPAAPVTSSLARNGLRGSVAGLVMVYPGA